MIHVSVEPDFVFANSLRHFYRLSTTTTYHKLQFGKFEKRQTTSQHPCTLNSHSRRTWEYFVKSTRSKPMQVINRGTDLEGDLKAVFQQKLRSQFEVKDIGEIRYNARTEKIDEKAWLRRVRTKHILSLLSITKQILK